MKFMRVKKISSYREGYYEGDLPYEEQREQTSVVVINPQDIKSYYPRKEGRIGTRINFKLGNGFAIAERVAEFEALLNQCGIEIIGDLPSAEVVQFNQAETPEQVN